jgi:Spy/CpxP family protein refolding chaperone
MRRNTRKRHQWTAAAVALAVGVLVWGSASAQPTRGNKKSVKSTKPAAEKLTDEQRAKVQEILREHREQSRKELREKLSGVLSKEQLERFEERWENAPGPRGIRGDRTGRRGGRQGFHGRRGSRGCDCPCGRFDGGRRGGFHGDRRGGGMGYGRGDGSGWGPGPHMGEFREERGERMVQRLSVVLDLTDAQRDKIETIVEEHQGQFKDLDRSQMTRDERAQMREAHRTLLTNRIKEVLTKEQAKKYDEWLETSPKTRRGGSKGRG